MTTTPATSTSTSEGATPIAGDAYAAAIDGQFDREQGLKASLEQRGLSVTAAGGALITIVLGLADAGGRPQRVLLVAAVAALFTGTVLGVLTVMPRRGAALSIRTLRRITERSHWQGDRDVARWRIYRAKVAIIEAVRRANRVRARLLQAAVLAEVAGVALVAACVSWRAVSG